MMVVPAHRELPPGFEYVQILGSGAFGEVVLARHLALGRLVAIKRIHRSGLADEHALTRFRREAQVLAALRHPSIVQIYDFKIIADDAVMVMEFARGRTLSDLLDDEALATSAGLRILRDVANALTAASALHVVHRDVKPGNVFVLADGHAKLGDFGLARIVADESIFRTVQGRAGGTPAYFPPEISQGLAEPDERADAYSFAVMAYEVLTGQLPFTADTPMAVIAAHWHRRAEDPCDLVPGFPRAAAAALLAGLEKNPALRPLPAELMTLLEAPADKWSGIARRSHPDGTASRRAAATRQIATSPAPQLPQAGVSREGVHERANVARRGRRRRGRWLVPGLAAASSVVIALTVTIVLATRKHSTRSPLRVISLAVDIAGRKVGGRCPAADFRFIATVATNGGAGTVVVRWTRPDRRYTTAQRLQVSAGARVIRTGLHFHVSGSRPLRGVAAVHVISPGDYDAFSGPITYRCPK